MSAGIKVATIADQVLVVYREKFYVVEKDAAQSRGGKALRYSKSSLPPVWKRALKGETPSPEEIALPAEEALPITTTTKRVKAAKEEPPSPPVAKAEIQAPAPSGPKPPRSAKKMEIKPAPQTSVFANCPYCNHKHELTLDKGKNGKPFFVPCVRCKVEFAVRLVPVTVYQAQVAGFR
jgi:hypothetical protein